MNLIVNANAVFRDSVLHLLCKNYAWLAKGLRLKYVII